MNANLSDYELKELNPADGEDIYLMLQTIAQVEQEFHNDVCGMKYEEFKNWLIIQNDWSQGRGLPKGYVKQWIYWFYAYGKPVGIGKLREKLTDHSRIVGGNIGYAISAPERGKGYGTVLFKLLLRKAKEIHIETVMSTVEKTNPISRIIQEKCGGILVQENDQRWYFSFDSLLHE